MHGCGRIEDRLIADEKFSNLVSVELAPTPRRAIVHARKNNPPGWHIKGCTGADDVCRSGASLTSGCGVNGGVGRGLRPLDPVITGI
jgi:hypothetical protein